MFIPAISRRCCGGCYGSSSFIGVQMRSFFVRRNLDSRDVLLVLFIPCRESPLRVNPLVVPMPCVDHVGVTNLWGG
jgi:hypothetical protein